ncbi:Palmitoyltransferase [Frankliniella fusca]|uniref:Palmitoyltransferase n=1 Tax=Frankliniella fusca TaxID=407009 RepID=A0AAE1L4G1_9NEOP|nr:Palmitoyltransferase [Frankliniella fusca]
MVFEKECQHCSIKNGHRVYCVKTVYNCQSPAGHFQATCLSPLKFSFFFFFYNSSTLSFSLFLLISPSAVYSLFCLFLSKSSLYLSIIAFGMSTILHTTPPTISCTPPYTCR